MAYMDDHGGRDSKENKLKNHAYESEEEREAREKTESEHKKVKKSSSQETTAQSNGGKGGILSRLRRALLGEQTVGEKARKGFLNWKMFGGGGGAAGLMKLITKLGAPKILAALVLGSGVGVFSILGIFTTYKNDGVTRNDPPLRCEQGVVELPSGGSGDDNDIQANVDVMYDIFCEELGYSKEALGGMLACMMVESTINPNRLESDHILTSAKEAFDAVAGPDTVPDAETSKQAYWTYGEAFQSGGGWNGNDFYIVDGHMCCGVGLIQWTAGRANKFFEGLDVIGMDVSPMSIQYQCAFLLAEMKSDAYSRCGPEGELPSASSYEEATEIFFTTMVSGGIAGDLLQERLAQIPEIEGYVDRAAANSEFRSDIITMAELLADDSFTSAVSKSNKIQICVNHTYVSTADIANAAVSISFLERGEYEDVHGAYGMYRRAARSPVMINDWNYVEGDDKKPNDRVTGVITDGTYGSKFSGSLPDTDQRKNLKYYTNKGAPGKLDLIACTEYYYFAHLIAFPKETGIAGNAGYFSSCDRGTATAVRIAGADDKFPAGNPLAQLQWAVGGKKIGSQHDPDRRGPQGAGFLWQFAGFLRGCDYYSASGTSSISPGTVMISWNVKAANGMLKEAMLGGATSGAVGDEGGVILDGSPEVNDQEVEEGFDESAEMVRANLRWPLAVTNTTRHIITFVGEGTVQKFWGMEWLYQQWTLFDDTDSLIRGDLTVEVPGIMKSGLSFKGMTAKKVSDHKATFYEQEMEGARTTDDVTEADFTKRQMSFNGKTGLPTFHSWEQIFARLVHNSDDDAAAMTAEGKDLYNEFSVDEDNYLDDAEDPDRIEQYQAWNTNSDKWFFEDWNSVGEGDPASPESDGIDDYKGMSADELPYGDDGSDKWTECAATGYKSNPFWRYELITDIEYRTNQLLRFGMASFMCSLPSEEDADVYQSGEEGNNSGHIMGNLYRRYSRIPNETDTSGRYFYYNTVVSNDMLQDLVQLWSHDRNGDKDVSQGGGDHTARHFGPMYLFGRVGAGMGDYDINMRSKNNSFLDRRYGLTASDVENIMEGLGGMSMGTDGDAVNEMLGKVLSVPMHEMSDAQLALYAREQDSNSNAYTDGRGAHESDHVYSEDEWYEDDIYGVNPFLMLESEQNLGRVNGAYTIMNGYGTDWTADGKAGSVRMKVDTELKTGVDGSNDEQDARLAWIDRHYVRGVSGNINMLAYQIAGLNPSVGKRVKTSEYVDELKASTTIEATATSGEGENTGVENADNLYGSWGSIRYTDFIYGEDDTSNQQMAKRLFGKDDRQGDGNTVRDDYNRREYIVIPYYHTHSQECDHSDLVPNYKDHYDLLCEWWDDNADNASTADIHKIDTQTWLNTGAVSCSGQSWWNKSGDNGDTISFDDRFQNRGKYDVEQLIGNGSVRYFTDNGNEIDPDTELPRIHVTCNGWEQYGPCYDGCSSGCGCPIGTCTCGTGGSFCSTWKCHACGAEKKCYERCYHTCEDCLGAGYCHDHTECDSQLHRNEGAKNIPCTCETKSSAEGDRMTDHHNDCGMTGSGVAGEHYTGVGFDGQSDDCHDRYGCNVLEFLYHNPGEKRENGEVVNNLYMVIQVVDDPIEEFDISNWMFGGKVVPDKANLLQQVYYEGNDGFVEYNWDAMTGTGLGALTNPDVTGYYATSSLNYISFEDGRWTESDGVSRPIGRGDTGDFSDDRTLFGIFTIEGNIIREKLSEDQCETIEKTDDNCRIEDFQRLESVRNRVGFGKGLAQLVNGVSVMVEQATNPAVYDSGLEDLMFDPSTHGEPGVDPNYGYGEVKITGAQHGLDPRPSEGSYGTMTIGAGPDGSKGNAKHDFGNSLFREILGDEHVQHVRFGSQNLDGLTADDVDNGRDFRYYVNTKRWEEHLDNEGFSKESTPDYYEASYYQKPGNTCPGCGHVIIPEDVTAGSDWLAHPSNNNTEGGVGGEFRDLDDDKLYLDPYNNIPTDKKYYDELKKKCTDDELNDLGQPNKENKKLLPQGANNDTQITNAGPSGSVADDAVNSGAAGDGDYNLWVTHASRGTRGMMTQYLNFKGFFKDASSDPDQDREAYMYMLFTVIKRTDGTDPSDHVTENDEPVTGDPGLVTSGMKGSKNADRDIDLKEDFVYSSPPGDAVDMAPKRVWGTGSVEIKDDDGNVLGYKPANFSDTYGQGENSHWKNLIDIYNAAMSETRHFD